MAAIPTPRTLLIKQLQLLLGDQMVEVELDPEHYNLSVDLAIGRLQQRSQGALDEKFVFLTMQPDQNEYTLPEEVQEVRCLYRRGVGANSTGGTSFDPFEASFSNLYLLQSGRTGGVATWDLFSEYQEVIGRVFGSEINFVWDVNLHKLTMIRRPKAPEDVVVHVYTKKDEDVLLTDPYSGFWLREYALAQCKMMLGQARSKFASGLPGPTGNVTLNGEALITEAKAEIERLEIEIQNYVPSGDGMPFFIG